MQNILKYNNYLLKINQITSQICIKKKRVINTKNEKFKSFTRVTKNFDKNILLREGGRRVKGIFRNSYFNKPLITVITVVLNDKKDLEKTIKSVLYQKYNNIEYIIIDGGSNGSVITTLKKYQEQIDYWISQKDDGIFDAYNKGIKLASGDLICFLNVGDYFTKDAFKFIIPKFSKKKNLDFIFGSVKKKNIYSGFNKKNLRKNLNIFPSLSSTFITTNIFKKFGLFDLNYKFYNDYELIIRLINKKKILFDQTNKNQIITIFDLKGFSSKISFNKRIIEEFRIRNKYEKFIILFFKMLVKYMWYYLLKFFNQRKFKKFN